jgi:hypothetical protein
MKKARWLNRFWVSVLSAWIGGACADPVTLQGEVFEKGSGILVDAARRDLETDFGVLVYVGTDASP